jgi:hypothetical protein
MSWNVVTSPDGMPKRTAGEFWYTAQNNVYRWQSTKVDKELGGFVGELLPREVVCMGQTTWKGVLWHNCR